MGKPVLHHKSGWLTPVGFLLLLITALLARSGGMKTFRATPGWMKFLSYAVLYYTIFGAFIVPRLRPNPGNSPERARQERLISDANYSLLIYFGAFEACYARLNSAREEDEFQSGINANSVG
jgi:hypothetical protein